MHASDDPSLCHTGSKVITQNTCAHGRGEPGNGASGKHRGLLVSLPLLVDMEVSEVIALRDLELLPCLVTLLLPALGTIEYRRHRQHGDNDLQGHMVDVVE